ncbi:MAG: glycerol-3-phosphate dehydrogenase [Actinomycetota bacterium]|nr:glycerol-3-phosphate dehydrogenase [Actinomycetota bacterium]
MRVAVVGAGSWGTAMAAMLSAKVATTLWARRPELATAIEADRHNPDYLPALHLPPALRATADLAEALDGADVVVMAVPSHGFRTVLTEGRPHIAGTGTPIVSLTKGVEQVALRRMSEIVAELMPGQSFAVLTGPNLVDEIVAGQPTASVVATPDDDLAAELQTLFTTGSFRVYTNPDVVGCELGGALKNVIAIAAGIADGMGFGDNTRGAVVTRGLAELARLGVALGGEPVTFSGLTGMGDLVATCTSRHSRNRWVGEQLSRGRSLADIVAGTRMVAEGVRTSAAVVDLAARVGVEMPIAEQVVAVLHHGQPPAEVVPLLMGRGAKPEFMPGAQSEGISPTILDPDTAPSQTRGRTIRA